jgi:hypothetical protein
LALTDSDKIKEQIRYNTEIGKIIAVLFVGTMGGMISLLLGRVDTGPELVFLLGGLIISPSCIAILYTLYTVTQKLISNGKV